MSIARRPVKVSVEEHREPRDGELLQRGVARERTKAFAEEPAEARLLPHDVVTTATSQLPGLMPFDMRRAVDHHIPQL